MSLPALHPSSCSSLWWILLWFLSAFYTRIQSTVFCPPIYGIFPFLRFFLNREKGPRCMYFSDNKHGERFNSIFVSYYATLHVCVGIFSTRVNWKLGHHWTELIRNYLLSRLLLVRRAMTRAFLAIHEQKNEEKKYRVWKIIISLLEFQFKYSDIGRLCNNLSPIIFLLALYNSLDIRRPFFSL